MISKNKPLPHIGHGGLEIPSYYLPGGESAEHHWDPTRWKSVSRDRQKTNEKDIRPNIPRYLQLMNLKEPYEVSAQEMLELRRDYAQGGTSLNNDPNCPGFEYNPIFGCVDLSITGGACLNIKNSRQCPYYIGDKSTQPTSL